MSVDFASAYVFRGVTFNDGPVIQPGLEVSGLPIPEEWGSLAIGTWANFDLSSYGGALEKNEFSEIDYYLSYSLPVSVVDLSVGYCEYTYPNGGSADREMSVSVGKDINGLYPSLTYNYGLDGAIEGSSYIAGGLDYGMDLSDALSASAGVSIGYLIADEGDDGFNDATMTIGLSYALGENWALNGSVSYVAQLDDDVLTDEAYDTEFYGMLGLSCDF
jgi:uncharacterized protein (TIGR02001 family)